MARSAPLPSLALLPALLAGLLAAAPASADVLAEGYELVVLGEPTTPAAPPDSEPADLTLTWRVREIFAGEPGSVSIAVRHRGLTRSQVRELGSGERWVLLANRDAERTGRWEAGMPLKATPGAVEAFRKWSAPPDVRPPRAVSDVVEELRDSAPPPPPAPEAEVVAAEGPIVVEEAEAEPEATVADARPPVVEEREEPAPSEPSVVAPAASEPGRVAAATAEPERLAAEPATAEPERLAAEAATAEPERLAAEAATAEPERVAAEPATAEPERVAAETAAAEPVAEPAEAGTPSAPGFSWLENVEPAEAPGRVAAAAPPVDRLERPAPETERVEIVRAAPPAAPAVNRLESPASTRVAEARGPVEPPPFAYRPVLAPPEGPGLPPPPPARPLGPPPSDREDLKKAKSSDDDA